MAWLARPRRILGIDLGAHGIVAVALRFGRAAARVEWAATAPMPGGLVQGHVLRDPAGLAAVLRRLVAGRAARGCRVVGAVPAAAVMMRRCTVVVPPGSTLDAAVIQQARTLVPDGLDEAVVDYRPLAPASGDAHDLLVVAARREVVGSYTAALRVARLEPAALDVDVLAAHRAYRASHPAERGARVLLVHVGARTATLAIARDDAAWWLGDVPAGAGVAADAIAAAAARIVDAEADAAVDAVVLTGPGAGGALADALGDRLRRAVRGIDPFATVRPGRRVDRAALGEQAARFTVAVGLALRWREDRP